MSTSPMNQDEKDRIGSAEKAIGILSGRMDTFDTRLEAVEGDTSETKKGVQVLLARTGGMEATRGMVPISSLLTVASMLIALLAVGFTMLNFTTSAIRADMNDDVEKASLRFASVEYRADQSEGRLNSYAEAMSDMKTDFVTMDGIVKDNRIAVNKLWDWYHDNLEERGRYKERVDVLIHSNIIDRLARLEETGNFTWEEIKDHEDEADHPLRQTQDIEFLKTSREEHLDLHNQSRFQKSAQ